MRNELNSEVGMRNGEFKGIDEPQNYERDSYYNTPTLRRRRIVSDHFYPRPPRLLGWRAGGK